MQCKLSEWQRKTLEKLIDQYENSKTYRGTNQLTQRFSIAPSKVFAQYHSDYADVNQVHDFENQMKELEQKDFLSIKWKYHAIEHLVANPQKWNEVYSLLGRKERRYLEKEQIELYERFLGVHTMLDRFCKDQISRLKEGKRAKYASEEAEQILKLWKFILENQEEILERELSIAVLGDSKLWGSRYCTKVCRLLKVYGDFDALLMGVDEEKDAERLILGEYHVVANPSYAYFKGNAELLFENGQELRLDINMPVAFTEKTVEQLQAIRILTHKVVTVENLTSFNRLQKTDSFYIFLSGYHNRLKQKLLCKIYEHNKGTQWFHFGDIDPDGFYIIEHLKRGTGIPFTPLYMDIAYLKKYDAYTKPLEKNDIRKAESLLKQNKYSEIMRYMLRKEKKLEQEIVSWMEK